MTDPVDLAYLNGMYRAGADPWRIESSWYERRKRDLVLSCLPRQRYRCGFEPGCAAGALTERLAVRTDELLACDLSEIAVRAAAARVARLPQVRVRQLLLPEQWPTGRRFDLIVLSELGYYFTAAGWAELTSRVAAGVTADATVLACHWRHDFAERTASTVALHAELDAALGLPKQSSYTDADLLIEVWTGQSGSLA
ncbi:MAG TPA: SAM-dependent methyltransferase [Jatrophihabitans sp.]|nr:SAM-dependent methyltransferase [Jatrophihabitans sp.]